jgi:hypothetical protein
MKWYIASWALRCDGARPDPGSRVEVADCDLKIRARGRRYLPFVFTEHGALMAASVLNTPKAVELSVYVVRAFVLLRELLVSNRKLAEKLNELVSRLTSHDPAIGEILQAIR